MIKTEYACDMCKRTITGKVYKFDIDGSDWGFTEPYEFNEEYHLCALCFHGFVNYMKAKKEIEG